MNSDQRLEIWLLLQFLQWHRVCYIKYKVKNKITWEITDIPSGFPNLLIGIIDVNIVLTFSGIPSVIVVEIKPGKITLHLILYLREKKNNEKYWQLMNNSSIFLKVIRILSRRIHDSNNEVDSHKIKFSIKKNSYNIKGK